MLGRPVLSMAAVDAHLGDQLSDDARAKLRTMILDGKKAPENRDAQPEVAALLARIAVVEESR